MSEFKVCSDFRQRKPELGNMVVLPMNAFITLCKKMNVNYLTANINIDGVRIIGSSLMMDGEALCTGEVAKAKMKAEGKWKGAD